MDYLATLNADLTFLAHRDFFQDSGNLYLEIDAKLLTLTEQGQMSDKTILASGLKQIIYGADGFADEFFPKVGNVPQREFVVNPAINYGRLSIVRLRVGADALAARYSAGEKMADTGGNSGSNPVA